MNERQPLGFFTSAAAILLLTASLVIRGRRSINSPSLGKLSSDMAFIPAGGYMQGSINGHPDEAPPHRVYVEAFYIDKYEVTNEQYLHFFLSASRLGWDDNFLDTKADSPDSHIIYRSGRYIVEAGYEQHPVTSISWDGAQAYCQAQGKRLPTEAEWEKAARGPDGARYPWGDFLDPDRLNAGSRVGDTTPVGSFPAGASPYGIYDLAGNVWEWTADWYQAYPLSSYHSPFFGTKVKVVRGGSWNHPDHDARSTQRDFAHPGRRIHVVGFRCSRCP